MISDLELARAACVDIYDGGSQWDDRWELDEIVVARRRIGEEDALVFRGSQTTEDWLDDLRAIPRRVEGLGTVHDGFYLGLDAVLLAAQPKLGARVYVTGHSLGAARAYIFGLILANAGLTPRAIVAFAPPRPGYEDFRDRLLWTGAQVRGYHNHFDPVPDVPVFPFCQPVPLIELNVPADPANPDVVFRAHHGALYVQGVSQLMKKEPA